MAGNTRRPVVAGTFYPADAAKLERQVSDLLGSANVPGSSVGVISPHAGYAYSGRTAARAIASLKQANRFIVLGPNHSGIGAEFSCMASGSWETPLGSVRVDSGIAGRLMKQCGFLEDDVAAHAFEHSIEVQLPFLQHRFGSFGLVPISIMNADCGSGLLEKCEALGRAVASTVKENNACIVASSDFSHYVPRAKAEAMDNAVMERVLALDTKGFFGALESTGASVCGYGPIAVLMSAANALGLKAKVVHKSDSGEATGDKSSVVAYYAVSFG